MASMKPCSEFGAKYTAMFAPGAIEPATSMSISTSPSAEPPGLFTAPSTLTATTLGVGSWTEEKYMSRSCWVYPPPSSMIPMQVPGPVDTGREVVQLADLDGVEFADDQRPELHVRLSQRPVGEAGHPLDHIGQRARDHDVALAGCGTFRRRTRRC